MKKSNKSWIYASTVLALALGAGIVVTMAESPAALRASADTVAQDSSVVSSAGSAVDAASSALTSAATSAAGTGITVTSSASNVSPSYISTPSATSSAVSSANSVNTSAYSSAASSAASYMSSQATSLSSVTSSYSSAVSSYNTAADSVAQSSLVWSDGGVAVYGSYNSAYADDGTNTKGSTSYYDYTVVASQADLEALLGPEYISGAVTATNNITDITGGTYDSSTGHITVTDPTQGISFTMNGVGTTNTGKQVNAVYNVTFGDATTPDLWISVNNAQFHTGFGYYTQYPYVKSAISFVDADGNPVNGIFLGAYVDLDTNAALINGNYPGESAGIYGLNDLTILNPSDSSITFTGALGQVVTDNSDHHDFDGTWSIPTGSFGYSGWGNSFSTVQIQSPAQTQKIQIQENGTGAQSALDALISTNDNWDYQEGNVLFSYSYAIEPTAPSAKIDYISVDKPVLYELVTPPKTPNTPFTPTPSTPNTPAVPATPVTPTAATKATPLSVKVSNTLPETGDAAGSASLMYGGFALLGGLTFAGVMTRKRRKLLEASKKAAESANEL